MLEDRMIPSNSSLRIASTDWKRAAMIASTVFVCSRLLLFLIWASVAGLEIDSGTNHRIGAPFIELHSETVLKDLDRMAVYNDGGLYYGIAQGGYEVRSFDTSRVTNWASFPLHPMIWRALTPWFGSSPMVGIVLANVYFLLALVMLHRLCSALGYEAVVADRAVLALGFFPTSYFFSMPWSESLFVLVTAATAYAILARQWSWGALLGIAACACRLAGLFLVMALLLWLWEKRNEVPRRAWIVVGLMPLGLVVFMGMLYRASGDALAFVDLQSVWGRHFELPIKALGVVLAKPWVLASDGNLRHLNFLVFVVGMATSYWLAFRRGQRWLGLFLVLGLIVPALTGSIASMSRYGMGLFPLAIGIGYALKNQRVERVYLVVSSVLFALMAIAFQLQLSFAGV